VSEKHESTRLKPNVNPSVNANLNANLNVKADFGKSDLNLGDFGGNLNSNMNSKLNSMMSGIGDLGLSGMSGLSAMSGKSGGISGLNPSAPKSGVPRNQSGVVQPQQVPHVQPKPKVAEDEDDDDDDYPNPLENEPTWYFEGDEGEFWFRCTEDYSKELNERWAEWKANQGPGMVKMIRDHGLVYDILFVTKDNKKVFHDAEQSSSQSSEKSSRMLCRGRPQDQRPVLEDVQSAQ